MKELLKQNLVKRNYDYYSFSEDEIVLEKLKTLGNNFVIYHVSREQFEKLKNKKEYDREDLYFDYPKIAGYHDGYKDGNGRGTFKCSGGLKLSNDVSLGSFIIENERIIYNPSWRFFEERDSFVYSYGLNSSIFTTMSMEDLLKDELKANRECLLYLGQDRVPNTYRFFDAFEIVTGEELLSYTTDSKKGEALIKRIKMY